MDVILIASVPGLGKAGEIHHVKPGYARNFLFARNLAKVASPEAIAQAKEKAKKQKDEEVKNHAQLKKLQQAIEKSSLELLAKGNSDGTLYGSLGAQDIRKALQEKLTLRVPEHFRITPEHLKNAGEQNIDWQINSLKGSLHIIIKVQQ
ncbi:MAG: 50S ribosomal protein L9 [Candidatus Nomurabacteria bacterium]|nr:MAG: 50S ribosomal protein L9 [Candidatus Nomurabacteria bacterium]